MSVSPARRLSRRALLSGAGFGALLAGVQFYQGRSALRGRAPELRVRTVEGEEVRRSLDEGVHTVHFWATWCGVCHAMASNVAGEGVIRIASQSGTLADVRGWMDVHPDAASTYVDLGSEQAREWGVSAYPTTFIVGGGRIVDAAVGYTTSFGLWLRRGLASAS